MRHEAQCRLVLAAEIDQRFASAQRCFGVSQKIQNDGFRFGNVRLAIFLLLRPSRASDEQQIGIRANRLLVRRRRDDTLDPGAEQTIGERNINQLWRDGTGLTLPRGTRSGIEQQNPRTLGASQRAFDALAIEPAGHRRSARRDVRR